MLDLLGLEWEGRLLGQSLFSTAGHEAVFASCWDRGRCVAMRQGDRKVVHHFRRKPTEVFDLSRDPHERRDLAPTLGDEELERLESAMRAYTLSVDLFWARHPMPSGGVVEEAAEPPPG
jgi:hypothetical protein